MQQGFVKDDKCIQSSVGTAEGRNLLGGWEDNIKINLKK
jgi:hypothetical protein